MEAFVSRNRRISNTYYNYALDRLDDKDLYAATLFLKKSLVYNKKNIDSRNLLGLIFYHQGEVVQALCQWIISRDFDKEKNPAVEYINRFQNDADSKNLLSSIKYYNSALDDIEVDRTDLAIMHLLKAIELNSNNVKALTLLGLIYIKTKDHVKAGNYLLKAQKIDKGNFIINRYMNYVLQNTKKAEVKEKRLESVYSIKKLEDDDAILPKRYIKLTTNQKIFFVVLGIFVGSLAYHTIIMPRIRQNINIEANNQIVEYADKVSDQNKTIRDINIEVEQLRNENNEANIKLRAYEEQNRLFTTQYETLNDIIRLFDGGYISQAARAYVNLDKENITDDSLVDLYNQAKSRIEGLGTKRLTELGTESWNAGNKTQAVNYYQLSLSINPDDPETMFLLARLYQSMGRSTDANPLFDKIIAEHPDTSYARRSSEARGY